MTLVDLGGVGVGTDWINVNFDPGIVRPSPNIVADIRESAHELERHFERNSIDAIRIIHTFEHLAYNEWPISLAYWKTFMKHDAPILIVVPDCGQLIDDYKDGKIHFDVLASVFYHPTYRENKGPGEMHRWGWNRDTLREALRIAGFKDIRDGNPSDWPLTWRYDYEEFQYTGAWYTYDVPNLVMVGYNR